MREGKFMWAFTVAVWWVKAEDMVVLCRDGVVNKVSVLCRVVVHVAFFVSVERSDGVLTIVAVNVFLIVTVGTEVWVLMDVGEFVGRREDV